jgi:hypothetical protein
MKVYGQRDQMRGNIALDKTFLTKSQKNFLQTAAVMRTAKEAPLTDLLAVNNEALVELDVDQINAQAALSVKDSRNAFVTNLIADNPTMDDKAIQAAVARYDANIQ